jgi:hypothetical protein
VLVLSWVFWQQELHLFFFSFSFSFFPFPFSAAGFETAMLQQISSSALVIQHKI